MITIEGIVRSGGSTSTTVGAGQSGDEGIGALRPAIIFSLAAAGFAWRGQGALDGAGEILVERPDHLIAAMNSGAFKPQDVERTAHRKRGHRNAARQSFEINQPERVCPAGKDEYVGGREGCREVGIVTCAEEESAWVAPLQRCAQWTVPDDDLGAGDGRVEKRLEILFGCDPADIEHQRPWKPSQAPVVSDPRVEQVEVDP